jgi:hypothetical protein
MRRPIRPVLLVALAAITAGCALTPDSTDTPWCDDYSVLMLEAQSVPSAQLLPCLDLMPKGWSPGTTHIDERGTTFTLDSTVAGGDAARIRLTAECATDGYVQVPSDESDTERFELVNSVSDRYTGIRVYRFAGGCASIDFAFAEGASASLANEVSLALSFAPRESVNQAIRAVTGGREQLDPVESD